MLTDGYTVPHNPQDYVDAVNWETVQAEWLCHAEIRGGARRLRSGNKGKREVEVENAREEKVEGDEQVEADWEDWTAPDPLIESDLSGSDYKEACRDLEKKRAWLKSRGRSATDTEEEDARIDKEDAKEERDLEHFSHPLPTDY